MDMTRRAALMTSAAIASSVLFPMRSFGQETPRKGGVFTCLLYTSDAADEL